MESYNDNIRSKKELLRTESLEGRFKECTFTPKVGKSPLKPRDVTQFIEDQKKFENRTKANIDKMMEEAREKEKSFYLSKPIINESSANIAVQKRNKEEMKKGITIYERLYSTRLSCKTREKSPPPIEKPIQEKTIRQNLNQSALISRLYEDAKIRKDVIKAKKSENEKKLFEKPAPSYSNSHLILSKFDRQFSLILSECNLANYEISNAQIDYNDFKKILIKAGFIASSKTGENIECEKLYKKLFSEISNNNTPDQNIKIPLFKLKQYIQAILNIPFENTDNLCIPKIQAEYKPLYYMYHAYGKSASSKNIQKPENSPSPQVQIFERRHGSFIDLVDSLIQSKTAYEMKMSKKKHDKEMEEREKCTFIPQINQDFLKQPTHSRKESHAITSTKKSHHANAKSNIFDKLYSQANPLYKPSPPKKDDKLPPECTFVPTIRKKSPPKTQPLSYDPLTDKTINRLRKARAERDRVRKMLERSSEVTFMRFDINRNKNIKQNHSKNTSILKPKTTSKKSKTHEIARASIDMTPTLKKPEQKSESKNSDNLNNLNNMAFSQEKKVILNIEVNLGERMEKIEVREGDTAEELAKIFAVENSIFF